MENISVSVRVRPLNSKEEKEVFAWRVEGNSLVQLDGKGQDVDRARDTKYELDNIFGPDWTTEKIYKVTTQPLIVKMVNGFNSTVFAYGQTSSGKTHTMRGTVECPGIIPLAVDEAFKLIESTETREYLIRVSYMEIYNEEVNDLLAPENVKLPIHESKENGPYVCGLREDIVTSPDQVLALLETGEANRHTGSTKMNEKSSRSHTIFRMVVESRAVDAEKDDAGAVLVSALSLVDLAGSERVAKTGAEGTRMREGVSINKSLLTLGNVIEKLSDGALAKGSHIPYRDSKLTRILQPSLGGNAKTAIICAMTPAWCHREESHITLRFACRAKRVVNNAIVNEVLSDAAVLKRQAKEIEELKKKLAAGNGGGAFSDDQINGLRAQLLRSEQEKELMRVKLQEEQQEKEKARQDAERAQKEAANTKKLLFQSRDEPAESSGGYRKNSRRETWCPGKSAWAAPAEPPSSDTPTHSGGGDSSQRKRSIQRGDGAGPRKSTAELSTLLEEDEEDDDVVECSMRKRSRREYSSVSEYMQEDDVEDGDEDSGAFDLCQSMERIMASLPAQDRTVLTQYMQLHQETEERVENLERDLEQERQAAQEARNDRSASDALSQQLEHAKWQARQAEKKIEELQAMYRSVEQERDTLSASCAQLESAMDALSNDFNARCKEATEKCAAAKEQAKEAKAELIDVRAKLERREYEFGKLESKEAESKAKLEEAEAKLKRTLEEMDSTKAAFQAVEERAEEAEKRGRELYEETTRLQNHVRELETRKRAPLYQKKQEEELKAAVEKAQECEVRAIEAELRVKELRATMEAVQKELSDLQDSASTAARQAEQTHKDLIEGHALELQRLAAESALQQEHHDEAVATLRAQLDELEATRASLDEQLRGRDQQLAALQEDATVLKARIGELEAQEVELQACAVAAQEKIAHLEQTAEAEALAHEAALAALQQQHTDALTVHAQAHLEALSSANAQHGQVAAQLEGKLAESKASMVQLEEELRAARERAEVLVKASLDQTQAAAAEKADLQRQVAELSAKVQEASGALKAKEELKEERLRSKQEIATLKAELQKLQLESKSGAKGKDLAQKEIDALKKRLTDTETKLRAALQDKTAALQEKGNLERQLKQHHSQKLTLEKTLEKKDALECKKRESMMVKSKEVLNTVEERLRTTIVEAQKLQMDLTAKQSECSGLEEQLHEQQTQNARLQDDVAKLGMECAELRGQLECLEFQHKEATGQLQSSQAELELARSACEQKASDLAQLQAKLAEADECEQRNSATIVEMRCQHDTLRDENGALRAAVDAARQAAEDTALRASQERADLEAAAASSSEEKRNLEAALKAARETLTTTQAELVNATAAHAYTQGQWQSAQGELQVLSASLKQREAQLEQCKVDLAGAVEAEQRLNAALADMRSQHDVLVQETGALQAAVRDSQAARAAGEDARQAAEDKVRQARAEAASLHQALTSREEAEQALRSQLAAAEESLAVARADLSANASMQEKLRGESVAQAMRANEALSAAQQCSEALEAELVTVRSQLVEAQALAASAATASDLNRALAVAQQRSEALEAELVTVRSQLVEAQALAASAATASDLNRALAVAQQRSEALEAELVTVRSQLVEAQALAASAATASDLNRALAVAQQRSEALEAELVTVRSQLVETQALAASAATASDLNRALAVAQQRSEALEAELVTVRSQLVEAQALAASAATASDLNRALAVAQQRSEALEAELVTVRSQLVETQALAASAATASDLNRALAVAQQRSEALEAELVTVRSQLVEAQALAASAATASDLNRALAVAQQRSEALEAELVTVRSQLVEAQALAASAATTSDLNRSLAAGPRLLPVDELQRRLNELIATNQELDTLNFSLTEQQVALTAERDTLASQLADALATHEELKCSVAQHVQQQQRLQHDTDGLSTRLANRQPDAEAQRRIEAALQDARQEAELQIVELQGRVTQLQAAAVAAAEAHSELQQRYDALQQERLAIEQQLSHLRTCPGGALQVVEAAAGNSSADAEILGLRARVADLLQRQADLEVEMSDVQAAHNVAVAERMTLERQSAVRVLELETANLRLQDDLAALQQLLPADNDTDANQQRAAFAAELSALRLARANAEANVQKLDADLRSAEDKIQGLQDALTAATAARASAEAQANEQVNSLLLGYDQLTLQCAQLQTDLNGKSADAEALRVDLAQAVEKQQDAERRGADLANMLSVLRAELMATAASRDEVVKRLAEVESRAAECQELQLQVRSLQVDAVRLTKDAADAKAAATSLDAEVQELLESNTLLESQLQELRASHAALQAQLASRPPGSDPAEIAVLAARLQESERLRSTLEQQVFELQQSLSAASVQQRAWARELDEARAGLEAQLATATQVCRHLQEKNAALDGELQAVRAQLAAEGSGHPLSERLHELQSHLQLQEDRHRLAAQELQDELAALQQHVEEKQRLEASLTQRVQVLSTEVRKLRDFQDELRMTAEQREAALNAEKLQLESQIHWLTEQNQRLQEGQMEGQVPQAVPDVDQRLQALEEELRKSRRAEAKLTAMLYRLRKDVEASKENKLDMQKLVELRSSEYDMDFLTAKCKRLQQRLADAQAHGSAGSKAQPLGFAGAFIDKENLPLMQQQQRR
ncbi:hypothetical protein PLESTM_001185400 [Pleodorina starrii]|nr:hypothetical protein PLESTM_001185400 [Pleodorina starrii]